MVGADIAGLRSLVLCQPLFPADPPRVAEIQSGKPGARCAGKGGKSIPRTFVMPVILPVPAAAASSFFTRGARDSFWLPAVSGIGCPEKGRDSVKRARAIGKRTRGLFTGQDER